jgi:NitT/TauT family transport system substrate-binding protein
MLRRLLLLLLFACGAGAARAEPLPVSIGFVPAADFVTVFAAQDQGFFAQHNLDAKLVKIPIITNIPPALMSDSLDIGGTTATVLLQSGAGGLDFVAIDGVSRFLVNNPKISVVVRSNGDITNAQGLEGKRVGVPGLESVADVGLQAWLMQNNVPLDKVHRVEANFPQMSDMLANGSVDAVAVLEPFRSKIINSGVGRKLSDYYAELHVNAVSALWMSTRAWATTHRDTVAAFRAAMQEAADYLASHPDAHKALEVKYLGYASPVPPSISLDIAPGDFAFYEGIMEKLGLLDHKVDVDKLLYQ